MRVKSVLQGHICALDGEFGGITGVQQNICAHASAVMLYLEPAGRSRQG